jgi:hypothetical protein
VENRRGSKRYWYDPHTKTHGETLMKWPYGYIRMTEGVDGDHVDCFIGPHEDAKFAYVIHQKKAPHFQEYDEDKVMLGFLTAQLAKRAYLQHFDSPRFYGSMTVIPIDRFVEHARSGDYQDGKEIRKAEQLGFGWEPIPRGKHGGQRRKKAGGGYEYRYPEFTVPKAPETSRGHRAYLARQQEINRRMVADPMAVVSTLYLNVSGGGEKARFVPVQGTSGLAGRNVGVQITAHEIPQGEKAIDRFAQHARREGLRLMVDSGEFPRYAAERRLPAAEAKLAELGGAPAEEVEKAKRQIASLRAKARDLDFDAIFEAYERLADAFPPGTVTVVAPDRVGDGKKTAELRLKYGPQVKSLMKRGVQIIVPFQSRDPEGLGQDYIAASEAFGEGTFVIGLPMAKKPLPMEVMLPFMTTLYQQGRFPKLHFLGGSQPEQMAERSVQLIAAAYWSSRGLPERRVLELCATPKEALRSLSSLKTGRDVLTRESEEILRPRLLAWAGVSSDDPDFDETEAWLDFFDDHPEEFDLELEDKAGSFREWASALVQFDTSVVNQMVMNWRQADLAGQQVRVSDLLEETPKRERHPGTLDRYLQSKVFQMERFIPGSSSGLESLLGRYDKSYLGRWRDLLKSRFGGSAGQVAGPDMAVGTGGNVGKPARTPGENVYAAELADDHPASKQSRKKRKKRKRREPAPRPMDVSRYPEGYARDKPKLELEIDRDAERNREWLDDEQERRSKRRDMGRLTLRPQEAR